MEESLIEKYRNEGLEKVDIARLEKDLKLLYEIDMEKLEHVNNILSRKSNTRIYYENQEKLLNKIVYVQACWERIIGTELVNNKTVIRKGRK